MKNALSLIFALLICMAPAARGDVHWIQPDGTASAKPIWGIPGGIAIGLWPTPGPRGLLRIYTPYLHQSTGRIMNFIAVEPIVANARGYSEMEKSEDNHPGKQMWTANNVDLQTPPPRTSAPATGIISTDGNTLSFYVVVERFNNGAKPIIKITLRADHPQEVSLQTFAAADSAPMRTCVLTATMGNYARLRHLHFRDKTINATDLFRNQPLDGMQFFHTAHFPADQLTTQDGDMTVSATADLDQNTPSEVPAFWRYQGSPAVQTWSTPALPDIQARVNGRTTFWGTHVPVPGGAAFENFELFSPFHQGQDFTFKITEDKSH